MSPLHGQFVWYELMTTDPDAATAFYRAVIGWDAKDAGMGADHPYTILHAGDYPVGGLMPQPPMVREAGAPPSWSGYVLADDVDGFAARVAQAGGAVHYGPEDIPGVGRFAVVGDPQGAVFQLFKGNQEAPPPRPAPGTPGTIGWHELSAADQPSAFAFYADLFGWTKGEAMDMGAMGVYQIFNIGGTMAGGMMTRHDPTVRPHWSYYICVDNTEAAIARAKAAGGTLLNGPMQVPGGSWIAHLRDPQGGVFAIVGPGTQSPG